LRAAAIAKPPALTVGGVVAALKLMMSQRTWSAEPCTTGRPTVTHKNAAKDTTALTRIHLDFIFMFVLLAKRRCARLLVTKQPREGPRDRKKVKERRRFCASCLPVSTKNRSTGRRRTIVHHPSRVNRALGPVSRKSSSQLIVETSLNTVPTVATWESPVSRITANCDACP